MVHASPTGSLSTVVNANPDTQATLFSVTIQDTADDPNDIFLVEVCAAWQFFAVDVMGLVACSAVHR